MESLVTISSLRLGHEPFSARSEDDVGHEFQEVLQVCRRYANRYLAEVTKLLGDEQSAVGRPPHREVVDDEGIQDLAIDRRRAHLGRLPALQPDL